MTAQTTVTPAEPATSWGRRVSPRAAARFPVELYCIGLPCALVGRSSDIGPGGIAVETPSPFALESLRRVIVELPSGRVQSKVRGRWQRLTPAENAQLSGVQFVDPERDATNRLWSFVHERAGELACFLRDRSDLARMELDEALDLALFTRVSEFPAGHWIYRQGTQGTRADAAFVLHQGNVLIEAAGPGGRKVELARLAPGGVFGGLPLVGGVPHVASAIALDDVMALEIDPYTLNFLHDAKPLMARRVVAALVRRHADHVTRLLEAMST